MTHMLNRRTFVKQASAAAAAAYFTPWSKSLAGAEHAIAGTSSGRVRGVVVETVNVFKGIPYGAPTSGRNRFMPPVKPAAWTGTRDTLAYGPTAPQAGDNSGTTASGSPPQGEDCLVLNVFTPGLKDGRKRKTDQRGAAAFAYRYDWETPEGGGHMRSPHTIEVPFVFNNIKVAGPLISKLPEAYALADKTSSAWVAFARTGDPNTPKLPRWPAYSTTSRDTMLFNNDCRVVQDPDRGPRQVMEQVLKLA